MKESFLSPIPPSNREKYIVTPSGPDRNTFVEQAFKGKEIFEFGTERNQTEKVQVIDIPADEKNPKSTVFIAPGFGEVVETLEPNIKYFAEEGRRTLTYNSLTGVSPEYAEKSNQSEVPDFSERKLAIIEKIIREKNLEGITGVGHSEGAANLIFTALRNPAAFKNLILIDPIGLMGDDSVAGLFARFAEHTFRSAQISRADMERNELDKKSKEERIKVVTENPLQAIRALVALSKIRIEDILRVMKKREVRISIIHGTDDVLFPMERMQQMVDSKMIDGFYSIRGGHNDYFLEPEKYSFVASSAIEALENKAQKESALQKGTSLILL
ncbi:MAG: alpha/beta hydrolase [Candidatus Paceibacterota bacterium]|jgi:pimeloyl-ACP methyl ester carboxylesterase